MEDILQEIENQALLEKELDERELLDEIDQLLSRSRTAAWMRFWKAGAGNEYYELAQALIEVYGNRKYEEGYSEGYEDKLNRWSLRVSPGLGELNVEQE